MPPTNSNWSKGLPGSALGNLASTLRLPDGAINVLGLTTGNSAVLPGPAPGKIRLLDGFSPTQVVAGSYTIDVRVQGPGVDLGAFVFTASATAAFLAPPYGADQVIRVINAGAPTVDIATQYWDVPASNLTLVQLALSNVAQQVIPAPPTGYLNRWLQFGFSFQSSVHYVGSRVFVRNGDSIGHTIEVLSGADVIARSVNIGSNTALTAIGGLNFPALRTRAGGSALSMRTLVPQATAPISLFGAYETIPVAG